MKMTKKKVLVTAIAVCLVAIISMGTLAWFYAEDEMNNNFVVDSLNSFDVDVYEEVPDSPDDDDDDYETIGDGEAGVTSYTYSEVQPGDVLHKKVFVKNTSENKLAGQYIRVVVTVTNYSLVHAMTVDLSEDYTTVAPFDCTEMFVGAQFSDVYDDTTSAWWYAKDETVYNKQENTVSYVFYLRTILEDGVEEYLFTDVMIPETMDINDADALDDAGGFAINVVAYAIQSANIKKPGGVTDLDHAVYAFGEAWDNRDEEPTVPTYPYIPEESTVPSEPEYS